MTIVEPSALEKISPSSRRRQGRRSTTGTAALSERACPVGPQTGSWPGRSSAHCADRGWPRKRSRERRFPTRHKGVCGMNDMAKREKPRLIQGVIAKCVDGRWADSDGLPLPAELLVVGTTRALQCWKDQYPVDTIIEQPDEPLPDVDELNAKIPEHEWELGLDNKPRPPAAQLRRRSAQSRDRRHLHVLEPDHRSTHRGRAAGRQVPLDAPNEGLVRADRRHSTAGR